MGIAHSCHGCRRQHSILKLSSNDCQTIQTSHTLNNTINLNRASEDEFLLLPGITRQLAQNIIDYRRRYNGFEQIDEILQVNGIHSDLFKRIRSDISIDVARTSSLLADENDRSTLININLASYEQLCSLPGLTPHLAKRIIQHRQRRGIFRFIEDLLEIKGIDYVILAHIRRYVTVDQQPSKLTSFTHSLSAKNLYSVSNDNVHRKVDTLSLASLLLETLPPQLQTILLSSPPQRPAMLHSTPTTSFRFASWNLQRLTMDKVQNPGVREVICRTILDNKYPTLNFESIQ
jgi:competence ComEA-like helix-hairpin-helix protein